MARRYRKDFITQKYYDRKKTKLKEERSHTNTEDGFIHHFLSLNDFGKTEMEWFCLKQGDNEYRTDMKYRYKENGELTSYYEISTKNSRKHGVRKIFDYEKNTKVEELYINGQQLSQMEIAFLFLNNADLTKQTPNEVLTPAKGYFEKQKNTPK
jgi:ribosomal protein S8